MVNTSGHGGSHGYTQHDDAHTRDMARARTQQASTGITRTRPEYDAHAYARTHTRRAARHTEAHTYAHTYARAPRSNGGSRRRMTHTPHEHAWEDLPDVVWAEHDQVCSLCGAERDVGLSVVDRLRVRVASWVLGKRLWQRWERRQPRAATPETRPGGSPRGAVQEGQTLDR